jgi:hypothetical protein
MVKTQFSSIRFKNWSEEVLIHHLLVLFTRSKLGSLLVLELVPNLQLHRVI